MVEHVSQADALFWVPPSKPLKKIFEFLAGGNVFENIPVWLPICSAQTLEVRVLLMSLTEGLTFHYH